MINKTSKDRMRQVLGPTIGKALKNPWVPEPLSENPWVPWNPRKRSHWARENYHTLAQKTYIISQKNDDEMVGATPRG